MADRSKIEWTDATWNVITGCGVVSPGCTNCYAMRLAGTRLRHHPSRKGLTIDTKAGPVWNGQVRWNQQWLDQPLRWTRPRMIFVCAHGDLFHESVPDDWIDRVFAVMARAPRHVFQVLTKRPERMAEVVGRMHRAVVKWEAEGDGIHFDGPDLIEAFPALAAALNRAQIYDRAWPLPQVWLGFSAEDQLRYDERQAHMERLAKAGWLTWLSAEPLLSDIDLGVEAGSLRWVVAGGESGPGARPIHPDWVRSLRDQCQDAEVPYHFKQWGAWAPGESIDGPQTRTETGATFFAGGWMVEDVTPKIGSELHRDDEPDVWRVGKKRAGRLLDGRTWDEMPEPRP